MNLPRLTPENEKAIREYRHDYAVLEADQAAALLNELDAVRAERDVLLARAPALVGETRGDRLHAWLWWGDGREAVVWDVQIYCARDVVGAVEVGCSAICGGSP